MSQEYNFQQKMIINLFLYFTKMKNYKDEKLLLNSIVYFFVPNVHLNYLKKYNYIN